MNVGRSEGSQVIQLFGRGVRLKGYEFSLKRSTALELHERPSNGVNPLIKPVETLNVFGIRADYMDQFKDILEEEGLPTNDSTFTEVVLQVMPTLPLDNKKLKLFRVKEEINFKKEKIVDLEAGFFSDGAKIKLDWYPKVEAFYAANKRSIIVSDSQTGKLTNVHTNHFDWFEIYEELIKFKNERSWYNLNIDLSVVKEILANNNWYELFIPIEDLKPRYYEDVFRWQEIGIALLKNYIDKFYNYKKQDYLKDFIEVIDIDSKHPNFFDEYKIEIEQSQESIIRQIKAVKKMIDDSELPQEVKAKDLPPTMSVFQFANHLYTPLIAINEKKYRKVIRITPVALNKGEEQFLKDLKSFYEENTEFFEDKSLYLLRNASRKGIGFFEANGFYPDFIIWLVKGEDQFVGFVDPKGLRQLDGFNNPKIEFRNTIKEKIEPRVHESDTTMHLSSFILSATSYQQVIHWRDQDGIVDFNKHNVYFLDDQKDSYIRKMLDKILIKG